MTSNQEQLERLRPTYDELHNQHQGHERRLEELTRKAWLTPNEEVEEKTLKKLKLRLKDQMAMIGRQVS